MQRARLIRAMVPNDSNFSANDVTGCASGGVKLFAAAMDSRVSIYDIATGTLMQVWSGGPFCAATTNIFNSSSSSSSFRCPPRTTPMMA